MSRLQWCLVGIVLAGFVAVAPVPGRVEAYNAPCHTHVTRQADSLWTFPELHDYIYHVIQGSTCEDSEDHESGYEGPCGHTVMHFWDADDPDNLEINHCIDYAYDYDNAWVRGRKLLNRAVELYAAYVASGSPATVDSAYHYFGHAVHCLTDMGAPCHVHVDWHAGEASGDACYEDWMCCSDCEDNMQSPCLTHGFGLWQTALDRWGLLCVDSTTAAIMAAYLADDCWEPKELQASYYYLMYTTNQVTDYFASDSYDGDTDDRLGLVSFAGFPAAPTASGELSDNDEDPDNDAHGYLTNIANFAYTKTISTTAAFYMAWRNYWDDFAPSTEIEITGAPEVHGGWRPNQVTVHLASDDSSSGRAIHDSGVWDMTYWIAGGDTSVFRLDYLMIAVVDEGINTLYYRARDRFGNEEALKSQIIKIDKTPPEVTIVSPTQDGLYLTDGSFTIDYEAVDAVSGVYSIVADMDGQPVSDGQVFSDLHNMGGYHTVTVAAEDSAGNTTTVSVDFSIKIHAGVDLTPNPLSTKSVGSTLLAEVEFPPEYDVNLINQLTSTLTAGGRTVPAKPWPSTVGHRGKNGLMGRILQFDREPICAALAGVTDDVCMTIYGRLIDSTEFYGTDTVEVFSPPGKMAASALTQLVIESAGLNPFSQHAVIRFGLPRDGLVEIDAYDVSGQLVMNLARGQYPAGYHMIDWYNDGTVGAGIYFLRLRLGSETATCKIVVSM